MYKRTTFRWLKHWDFMLLDCVLLQIAFAAAYIIRNGQGALHGNLVYRNAAVFLFLLSLCVGVFMESYKGILRRGYWQEFKATVKYVLTLTVGAIVYLYVFKTSSEYSRLALGYFPVLALLLQYPARLLLKFWLRCHRDQISRRRGILLVAASENYQVLIDDFLKNPYSEFQIVAAAVLDAKPDLPREYREVELKFGEEELIEYVHYDWVDEVFFSLPQNMELPENAMEKCRLMGLTIHVELAKLRNRFGKQLVEKIEGYAVLSNTLMVVTPGQMFLKRAMDIMGGMIGLLLTGVIFVFVAPAIYISSPGPVFFRQVRMGKNGRKFNIYKFRSMYMDAEERKQELMAQNTIQGGVMFKMDDDPRIIKGIGHFIRDFSLDEFPQFWNVLKGDMSLVGTRPPTEDEWKNYDYHHRSRLAAKPGLTGMWQVSGRSDITDFEEVVRLDNEYIQNWSLGLDIRILFQTVGVVLGRKGSK